MYLLKIIIISGKCLPDKGKVHIQKRERKMNEKVQNVLNQIDKATEKLLILPKKIDLVYDFIKKPVIAGIPAVVTKLASKFSVYTVTLLSLVYALLCLKNMTICFGYKDAPAGMGFWLTIAAFVALAFNTYILYKTDGMFEDIIKSSQCRISSCNIFAIMTMIYLFTAVVAFFGGIYLTIEVKAASPLFIGIGGAFFFLLMALYNSTPEDFAIVEDKEASAGEDFIALTTFSVKVVLRLLPIVIFALSILGIVQCIPAITETYTESFSGHNFLHGDIMVAEMTSLGAYLLIGLLPLFAYFYYLASYVSLDLIRAILSMPRALSNK